MGNHPIDGMLGTTMEKIKEMVDVDSVIGKPITTPDGTTVIPISKVSYGFASGGSDFPAKSQPAKDFFGGGAGAGITITPIAFLSICNGDVKLRWYRMWWIKSLKRSARKKKRELQKRKRKKQQKNLKN